MFLYIVATPIGNLEDITQRALRILKEVDLILCEDTRKSGILLKHYGIETPKKSYRIHHIKEDTGFAIEKLKAGQNLALITDAGTPGISDPGSYLVRSVRESLPEVKIIPVPGPSALAGALSVSGFQANPSVFAGFLSPKEGRRREALHRMKEFEGCVILYESVHRIERLLREIREILPERDIFIAREITKVYEEYIFIPHKENLETLSGKFVKKGEFTVIIGPQSK